FLLKDLDNALVNNRLVFMAKADETNNRPRLCLFFAMKIELLVVISPRLIGQRQLVINWIIRSIKIFHLVKSRFVNQNLLFSACFIFERCRQVDWVADHCVILDSFATHATNGHPVRTDSNTDIEEPEVCGGYTNP